MADKIEIEKAIGAHGMWKSRLLQMVETGTADTTAAAIRVDNQCVFGKWLYGSTLTAVDRTGAHYTTVKDLHAQFHVTAAKVAEHALAGRKAEAEKMLAMGGEYAEVSSKLTSAMMAWKKSLHEPVHA
ncbi:MAG: CZB domain-containing protein [Vicinamibacterales bacterium]